jgi:hypothetical protein
MARGEGLRWHGGIWNFEKFDSSIPDGRDETRMCGGDRPLAQELLMIGDTLRSSTFRQKGENPLDVVEWGHEGDISVKESSLHPMSEDSGKGVRSWGRKSFWPWRQLLGACDFAHQHWTEVLDVILLSVVFTHHRLNPADQLLRGEDHQTTLSQGYLSLSGEEYREEW